MMKKRNTENTEEMNWSLSKNLVVDGVDWVMRERAKEIKEIINGFREKVKMLHSENKQYYTEKFKKEKAEGEKFWFQGAVMANTAWATLNDITAEKEELGKNRHFEYSDEAFEHFCGKQEEEQMSR